MTDSLAGLVGRLDALRAKWLADRTSLNTAASRESDAIVQAAWMGQALGRQDCADDLAAILTEARASAEAPPAAVRPPQPTSWTCSCGWTNGIALERCATCTRKPGYDWERKEDNPCTQQ